MTQTTNTQPKPRKLRGWATYEGDEFTFKPTEEGSPSQLNVKTCKGAKVGKGLAVHGADAAKSQKAVADWARKSIG